MSFIRPEAKTALRRYGEPAIYAVVAAIGLLKGISLLSQGAWVGLILAIIGLVAFLGLLGTLERTILAWRGRKQGPGVVSIHEGQISYFGPEGGAVLAMDALVSIDIVTTDAGPYAQDLFWHLTDEVGQQAIIPGGAQDATNLLDRLGSLPGFDHMAVISAMGSTDHARFRIWRRPDRATLGA